MTVALYELEPYTASDIAHVPELLRHARHASRTSRSTAARAPPPARPGARDRARHRERRSASRRPAAIEVYQGPNGWQRVLDTLAGDRRRRHGAGRSATPGGLCEPRRRTPASRATRARCSSRPRLQGQTILVASGDDGSEGCTASGQLAVDDPASQPFATAVGGTALHARLGPPPTQTRLERATGPAAAASRRSGRCRPSRPGPGVINPPLERHAVRRAGGLLPRGPRRRPPTPRPAPATSSTTAAGTGSVGGTSAAAPVWAA